MDSDMKMMHIEKSDSSKWLSHISPQKSKWLFKNATDMDRAFNSMLKMIQEHEKYAVGNEMNSLQKTKLVAGVHEFYRIYHSLATRYDHLAQVMQQNLSTENQLQDSDHNVSPSFPPEKLHLHNSTQISVSYSSGGRSSDLSPNAGSQSSSSSDSESESYNSSINNYLDSPKKRDNEEAEVSSVRQNHQVVDGESEAKFGKQNSNEELSERVAKYEEELRIQKLKLQLSEQEVRRLECELEKGESCVALVENLQARLEDAQNRSKLLEQEVKSERVRVAELEEEVLDLKSHVSNSSAVIEKLITELGASQESLKASVEEIAKLREELHQNEQDFSLEKVELQSDIVLLSEKQTVLETRLQELESSNKSLEDMARQHEAETSEMKASHESKEAQLQREIGALKCDLVVKIQNIERLNKEFDMYKQKFDMFLAEKDGMNATIDKLRADLRSRDIEIRHMEDILVQVRSENNNIISESAILRNVITGLESRVNELEKEVERQRMRISEGEEEKREAVRQLCFTLDHYKTGYRQLCRQLSAQNRQPLAA